MMSLFYKHLGVKMSIWGGGGRFTPAPSPDRGIKTFIVITDFEKSRQITAIVRAYLSVRPIASHSLAVRKVVLLSVLYRNNTTA